MPDVFAHPRDEGAEGFRLADVVRRAKLLPKAGECFLDDVFRRGRVDAAVAEHRSENLGRDVVDEVVDHSRLAGNQTPEVLRVERKEFQQPPPHQQSAESTGPLRVADYGVRVPPNSTPSNFRRRSHCSSLIPVVREKGKSFQTAENWSPRLDSNQRPTA